MARAVGFLVKLIKALIFFPIALAIALPVAVIYGAVGGIPSAVINTWPIIQFYYDRCLMELIPERLSARLLRPIEAYIDFYSDPHRR